MNDQPDPIILVGGALTIQNLVKRYASLKGWERVQTIESPGAGNMKNWSRRTAQAILAMSKPGDKILIFLPDSLNTGWLKTLEASGRITAIPLFDLSVARQITTLHRWIAALESKPKPFGRFARFLKRLKVPALLIQKFPRRSSRTMQQGESRRSF